MLDFGFYHMDCMKGMKEFPDKYFDLAIVDPPYFKGVEKSNYFGKTISKTNVKRLSKPLNNWEIPNKAYFNELFRISKNQIIWGCNYFDYQYPGSGRIVWDKQNDSSTFSNCEIAYCSLQNSVKIYRFMWNGMLQANIREKENRIHPTQKPIALYEWILQNYANPGDIILDTHVGSASSLIACRNTNHKYVGFEIDPEYYRLAKERLDCETAQMNLFDFMNSPVDDEIQGQMDIKDFLKDGD